MVFNTIVHAGNFADVPMLTAFFAAHADVVRFGSFQLQADTGRGVLGAHGRHPHDSVAEHLQRGASTLFRFNVLMVGHGDRNRSRWGMTQRVLSMILMAVSLLLAGFATEAEAAWGACCCASNERCEVDFQAFPQDRADLDRYLRYVADIALV